ncbi:6162_t:CDS:1 [Funneliformis geosporum]|uniref:6162_t:CDS:1 n=1 Tax=Funneliformis geosporum TaxID=1117311 RepID=A0A9W4WMG1_9GLOM|nr:6162_t:CDS:1 [Funneliformis geosporum]
MVLDINKLHELEYCHKNLHSGNILLEKSASFLTDFGLSGPANKSSNEVYGVLPYVAPEVLYGNSYTTAADIYSFGIIMIELSSGKPPHHDKKHDNNLAIAICNGLRPDFGKGTPEFYKDLAYRCMDANLDQRPTANELYDHLWEWEECIRGRNNNSDAINIRKAFEQADKEIPYMRTSYTIHPDAVFTSKRLCRTNLP